MLHTSIGFHTFTIFQSITRIEAETILNQFKEYSEKTGNIKIFQSKNSRNFIKEYCVSYIKKEIGIVWIIRFCNDNANFKYYQIVARVNPKILIGTDDYITAATENDLSKILFEFKRNAAQISERLVDIERYRFQRIDYCINFDLKELEGEPLFFMNLIQHSNIPAHFEEKREYDNISHRRKRYTESFYLKSNSVTINCYCKQLQLQKQFPDCPNMEQSKYIIRFEIQCSYKKIYNMIQKKKFESFEQMFYELLSNEQAQYIIERYYKKTIMLGDYYTLKEAKKKIELSCYSDKKKEYLIDVLIMIAKSRGVMREKGKLSKEEKIKFEKALKELQKIGINPVTLPKRSKINCIPNLLENYINS